jgi:hypothetical protein
VSLQTHSRHDLEKKEEEKVGEKEKKCYNFLVKNQRRREGGREDKIKCIRL